MEWKGKRLSSLLQPFLGCAAGCFLGCKTAPSPSWNEITSRMSVTSRKMKVHVWRVDSLLFAVTRLFYHFEQAQAVIMVMIMIMVLHAGMNLCNYYIRYKRPLLCNQSPRSVMCQASVTLLSVASTETWQEHYQTVFLSDPQDFVHRHTQHNAGFLTRANEIAGPAL